MYQKYHYSRIPCENLFCWELSVAVHTAWAASGVAIPWRVGARREIPWGKHEDGG
jgi:hypothetical protein